MKRIEVENLKAKPEDYETIGFGKLFTDYMFVANYNVHTGWDEGCIQPFANLSLHPAATALHYAQEIFEGMKAFRGVDGKVRLFRVEDNFNRFNASADAIAMPEIPRELFVGGIEALVALEKDWLIYDESVSLYIRPFMIGVDQTLGLKPADDYMFIVILSLAGDYYQSDDFVKIKVEHEHVRAAAKGIGRAKTGGNYAASLKAYAKAKQEGFDQVLWLDGTYGKYVEEVGAMNIFFVIDGVITTPILNDSILPGIVRDSILHFAKALGYKTSERKLSMDEIVHLYQEGHISEVFGSGTAAVVSPVGMLSYQDYEMSFTSNSIAQSLKRYLLDLEYGHRTTDVPWITVL